MVGQRVGYSRVSTLDQHTERQLDGIEVDKTFTDKASGKNTKRPQLEQLMSFVRSGDTVIVHSMDRFARNVDDLRRIVQTLTGRGVQGNRFLDLIGCIRLFAMIWAASKSFHNRLISVFSGCVHFAIQRPAVESA
jgi:hypothetical protein